MRGDSRHLWTTGHVLYAHCDALVRTGVRTSAPTGYGPADFQSAYKLTAASQQRGKGQTVAIVDAYNDPNLAKDLATYRANYKLPACTKASGCPQPKTESLSTIIIPKNIFQTIK